MEQESDEIHFVTADEFGEWASKQIIEQIKDKYEFKDNNIDWTIVITDWFKKEKEKMIKEREDKLNSDFE